MRTLLVLFFVSIGFSALAQPRSYRKTITSDGQRLHIRVDIRDPDHSTHYDRSFDVSSLSQIEVQALETHVLDSLAKTTEGTQAQTAQPAERFAGEPTEVTAKVSGRVPYEENVEENRTEGRLKIRFTFNTDGQENSVERTAIIRDATEAGRRRLREEIERQLTAEMDVLIRGCSSGV